MNIIDSITYYKYLLTSEVSKFYLGITQTPDSEEYYLVLVARSGYLFLRYYG